jgi:pimeloyl-ACP methyl ester carboxylesterase
MTTIEAPVKYEYDRIPHLVAYQNTSAVRDVYGGVAELVVLESYLLKPKTKPSDTVLVFMHPIGGGAYLPMINALARAGHHVIYCNSRFRGTDSALLMEKVVEDLGEAIKDAKNRLDYDKVVLAGWSGGGSLSVFYQQQAKHPTVTASPSGDGPGLTKLGLTPADGIMMLAAHISRHDTLTEWPGQARSGAGSVQPGQPQPAALHRGIPRALSGGSDRTQSANHEVGQGETCRAQGRRATRRRVRVRRARHHGRPPLAGPDRRPERARGANHLPG